MAVGTRAISCVRFSGPEEHLGLLGPCLRSKTPFDVSCLSAPRFLVTYGETLVNVQAPHHLDMVLQSLEVRALNRLRGYSRILEELLLIIASPVFSEIVVVEDVR